MKIVAFSGLPFHRWCLEDVVASAEARGHDVVEVEHIPVGDHDWWTGSLETRSRLAAANADADFLLVADYPYAPLQNGLRIGAKIVTVRHSLASRGNTYQPEQADADVLVMFSESDKRRLNDAGLLPPLVKPSGKRDRIALGAGCPWAARMCGPREARHRAELRFRFEIDPTDSRPIVAVATTWNDWTSLDVVRALAADGSRIVIWRPHWAASWRRPREAELVRSFGAYVDDPLAHPARLLMAADALVGDVSGIVLLATLARTNRHTVDPSLHVAGGLPIVQIDPDPGALAASGQLDPVGPEWAYRDAIGPRIPAARAPDLVPAAVDAILSHDPWRASRAGVALSLTEPYTHVGSAIQLVRDLESW